MFMIENNDTEFNNKVNTRFFEVNDVQRDERVVISISNCQNKVT